MQERLVRQASGSVLCPRDHLAGLTKCKYDAEDTDFEKCLLNFLVHEYND